MDLPSPASLATHMLAFGLGVITFWLFTRWEARRVTTSSAPPPRKSIPLLAVISITIAAVMIGFGIQQGLYQRQATGRDECYQAWGEKVISNLETRVASTGEVEQAQKELDRRRDMRSNAFAHVVEIVVLLRVFPPQADEDDLDQALSEVARTDRLVDRQNKRVARIESERDTTRAENPYPNLEC
jgi:hypothetical protein